MNPAINAYMNGNCHHLARALHAHLGAGIGVVLDFSRKDPDDPTPVTIEDMIHGDVLVDHVFALLPDGRALDIHGVRDPDKIVIQHYWSGGELNTGVMLGVDPSLIERLISEAGWASEPPGAAEGLPALDEIVENLLGSVDIQRARQAACENSVYA